MKLNYLNYNFCFSVSKISLIITCSGINSAKKNELIKNLSFLKPTFSNNWSVNCTHIIVEDLKLTPKVLCGLIENQTIVTLKFWDDYIAAVKNNRNLPNPLNYKPDLNEASLDKDVDLSFNPNRKTIFQNKIFVFPNSKLLSQVDILIKVCGGDAILFNNLKLSKEEILASTKEYIFIQDLKNTQNLFDDTYENFLTYMKHRNRFSIPIFDIGLAVVYCSCEKHCNSHFDKACKLITTMKTDSAIKKEIAPETQDDFVQSSAVKEERIIPDTESMLSDDKDVVNRQSSLNSKRQGESLVGDNKKQKLSTIDNDPLPSTSSW